MKLIFRIELGYVLFDGIKVPYDQLAPVIPNKAQKKSKLFFIKSRLATGYKETYRSFILEDEL